MDSLTAVTITLTCQLYFAQMQQTQLVFIQAVLEAALHLLHPAVHLQVDQLLVHLQVVECHQVLLADQQHPAHQAVGHPALAQCIVFQVILNVMFKLNTVTSSPCVAL